MSFAALFGPLPLPTHPPTHTYIQAVAERVGLEVEIATYCDGKLSNYPAFLFHDEEGGREQVLLIARKPKA